MKPNVIAEAFEQVLTAAGVVPVSLDIKKYSTRSLLLTGFLPHQVDIAELKNTLRDGYAAARFRSSSERAAFLRLLKNTDVAFYSPRLKKRPAKPVRKKKAAA